MKRILLLFVAMIGLAFVGAAGAALVMPAPKLRHTLNSLPLVKDHADRIIGVKQAISTEISNWIDDARYSVASRWRDLVNYSPADQTPRVIIELEPVRQIAAKPSSVEAAATPTDVPPEMRPTALTPPPQPPAAAPADTSDPAVTDHAAAAAGTPGVSPAEPAADTTMKTPDSTDHPDRQAAPLAQMPPPANAPVGETATSPAPAPATTSAKKVVETATLPPKPESSPPPAAPVADNGVADHKKGLAYYQGAGVTKNFKTAKKWFEIAAAKGNAAAQYNLGIMSYLGQGTDQDYAAAAKWFRMAAEQDHALAQYNLGFLYYGGKGVEKDDLQAFMWIDRAAGLGDEKAIKARDSLAKILPKDIFKKK